MNFLKNTIALTLTIFALAIFCFAQTEKAAETAKTNQSFDAELAKRLGADGYGMRQYVFVVLKTGKAKIEDEKKRKELQAGHMQNISRLANEGKLVLAGPFIEGGEMRGIYIFNVKTIEEARELVKTDPAIKEGLFDVELTKWYGSAALLEINSIHNKIQKNSIED